MLADRLSLALDRGLFAVPAEGRIAVFGARAGDDLSDLPKARVQVIQRHAPDFDVLQAAGYDAAQRASGRYALALVCLPRAKTEGQAMIAEARARTDGIIVVDGAKTDGIDRMLKDMRRRANVGEALAKAHGKIFAVTGGDFPDWAAKVSAVAGGFVTPPGAFSADGIDPASEALATALPPRMAGRVVDLGAGWGYLASEVLKRDAVTAVDLVEADYDALEAARQNVTDPRAAFHWSDARRWQGAPADHVVTNPPFHNGRKGDTGLGQAFLVQAARVLKPSGTLWLVANRHLPYEKTLETAFADIRELDGTGSFKLYSAAKPRNHAFRTSKG